MTALSPIDPAPATGKDSALVAEVPKGSGVTQHDQGDSRGDAALVRSLTSSGGPIMASQHRHCQVGFHDGELAVQQRAGVADKAARLSGMLAPVELGSGVLRFLADRTFAVLTGRDPNGHLWASPLSGAPGFLHSDVPSMLRIHAVPGPGDPLHEIEAKQPVGLVVVEFATRRRVRINGTLGRTRADELSLEVEQAYGNCPQYIQERLLNPFNTGSHDPEVRHGTHLEAPDLELIRRADTFFVGTAHPTRGADASHRGGPAGFVRVNHGEVWWPDYHGNNMFNTLGNLAVDPTAALLFPDFTTGTTLQLSGSATIEWTTPGVLGDDGGTGRMVHFSTEQVVAGHLLHVRADRTLRKVV